MRAAEMFLDELDHAIERIGDHPAQFPEYAFGTRRMVLQRFPYLIVFRETAAGVEVIAESGAGDEVIMSIAGHVSRAMLSRYSHVRMEAKRRALDEIAVRQRAADEKRQQELGLQQAAVVSPSVVVQ